MKKIIAVLLAFFIISTSLPTSPIFMVAAGDNLPSGEQEGNDLSTEGAVPLDELLTDELTLEQKAALINSAELHPVTTGYEPLDTIVQNIFDEILTQEMDIFEKVRSIYAYLMTDTVYDFNVPITDYLYANLSNEIKYKSTYDSYRVCEAYGFLESKHGVCQHFSSAFMVLTRRLGLETYVVDCLGATETSVSSHECSILRINGNNYLFDPVMGVYLNNTTEVENSGYFCTPLVFNPGREYCDLNEIFASYNGFETGNTGKTQQKENVPGETEDDVHFSFGKYPQSQVSEASLIAALNEHLDTASMMSYGYYTGTGRIGSQTASDYMRYADIEYEGETYRAVTFSSYRPTYSYKMSSAEWSYQDNNGFVPNEVYWFLFEPIEWRLLDGGTLLISDLAIDAQPFNEEIFASDSGETINNKTLFNFKDAIFSQPVNDWGTSDIRTWLNNDFFLTAFTDEEQALIKQSTLHNYSSHGDFDYEDTIDKIFLLSRNEVVKSNYFLAESEEARTTNGTDYAMSQGLFVNRKSDSKVCWILRSAGGHSGDIGFVTAIGRQRNHLKTATTLCGIRPALRVTDLSALIPETLSSPRKLTATATATGQITLQTAVCNGADGYNYYLYIDGSTEPVETFSSSSNVLTIDGLTPGVTYTFRSSAFRCVNEETETSYPSPAVSVLCRAFIDPPVSMAAEATATHVIMLTWTPSEGAERYRIYRYLDSDTLTLCGETTETSLSVEGLSPNVCYYFKISAIPQDNIESKLSSYTVVCTCLSIPAIPQDLTLTPIATGVLRLSWTATPGADCYHVEKYSSGKYIEIAETETTALIDSVPYVGTTYYYRIRAEKKETQEFSSYVYINGIAESFPPSPKDVMVTPVATGVLRLNWTASLGAARYHIERYFGSENAYIELGITEETEYTISGLSTGVDYYFHLTAETEDGTDLSAIAYAHGICESIPPVPQDLTLTPVATGVLQLNWSASPDANLYHIEKYSSGSYKEIGATGDTTFTDDSLTVGTTYYYRIRAEKTSTQDFSAYLYANGKPESFPPVPQDLTAKPIATGAIRLSWTFSPGAARYRVERYVKDIGYVELGVTTNSEFTVTGLSVGTIYSFHVIAETADGSDCSAPASVKMACESFPSVPQNVTGEASASRTITLRWTTVEDAAYYNVYRFISTTELTLVGSTEENTFTETGRTNGREYTYRVKAVSLGGTNESAYSASVKVKCEDVENHICTHDYLIVSSSEPTCTENGMVFRRCSLCGSEKKTVTVASGHDVTDWGIYGETAKGVCSVCGETVYQDAAAIREVERCELCGEYHRMNTGPFSKNGFLCRLIVFFRSLLQQHSLWQSPV